MRRCCLKTTLESGNSSTNNDKCSSKTEKCSKGEQGKTKNQGEEKKSTDKNSKNAVVCFAERWAQNVRNQVEVFNKKIHMSFSHGTRSWTSKSKRR